MFDAYQEHCDYHYASDAEVDQAEAHAAGAEDDQQAWILSDRDVWYANPYYMGPEVPHPEYDNCYDGEDDIEDQEYPDINPAVFDFDLD